MSRVFVKSDDPLYKYAISFMEKHWGTKGIFPGSQPVSIERKHFGILAKNDYVVCEKTDGTRYMMLAFMYETRKVCVFLNRALEMFTCSLNFRKPIYDGTILEGELYENTFMIYDCLMTCGEIVGNQNFLERLEHCEKTSKKIMVLKTDPILLKVKKFHLHEDFEEFMDVYLPTVKQEMDGLIFTPVNEPIRIGTHETLFKWKPREKNTVDFYMKKGQSFEGGPVWKLYVQEKGKLFFESEFPLSRMNEPWFEEDAIVECMYVTWEQGSLWWKPLKRRLDKTHPNNRRTFYRTIVNIKEDIQMKEFLDCRPAQAPSHTSPKP